MYFDLAFIILSALVLGIVYFLLFAQNGLKPKGKTPARVERVVNRESEGEEDDEEHKFDPNDVKTRKEMQKEAKRQEKKEKREVPKQ